MLKQESRIVADPAVLSTVIDGGVMILDALSGKYFHLEKTGAEIWREIEEPKTVAALCDTLAQGYDAPRERIDASVIAFLSDLLDRRLIKLA